MSIPICSSRVISVFIFFKIVFIDLTEIETASERGNSSRGSGEEEAGSQQRSLMWGSIPRLWDHALCRRQTLKCCATQVPPSLCLLILMSVLDTGCTAHMQNVWHDNHWSHNQHYPEWTNQFSWNIPVFSLGFLLPLPLSPCPHIPWLHLMLLRLVLI